MQTIVRGEDRLLVLRMLFKNTHEPFDLDGVTKITVQFTNADRTVLEKTTDLIAATKAAFTYQDVIFVANTAGNQGNNIELVFDGNDNVTTVVDTWNAANPTNLVTHNGTGLEVLDTATIQLNGGRDAYQDVEIVNATLGKISVKLTDVNTSSLRRGSKQNIKAVVDKGEHPNGERRIVIFESALNVIDGDL